MNKSYDFKEIEQEVLEHWRTHKADIDAAIKLENKDGKERYNFLEGPPTANAPPALHHVEMRVFKDLATRFRAMQGYKVSRKGGWDTHGLPVEVQVEKKLGLASKKEVVEYGIENFIQECKDDVFRFIGDWTKNTERLGFWVDLEEPYVTLKTKYMESVWWALAEIYKKDLLYLGHKIVPYCARCATPLSSHEVAQGYKDVEDISVVAKFKIVDTQSLGLPASAYFLAWTTTPWTLPSNLALAVHPEVNYLAIESEGDVFLLAQDLVEKYFSEPKIVKLFKGTELVNAKYEPLFDYFKETATNSFRIISADYVTTTDGTGIVHQAPAFGEDDNLACEKNGIDFVNPVDDNGEFTSEVKDYEGMFVKDADSRIIADLDTSGKLFKETPYIHSYPFCWRCKTPLIYYAKDTWFIEVSKVKDRLVELNEDINWYPKNIKDGRFGNWLAGARDWALSRNKFWGTPLPLWCCENEDCGHKEAIGSIEELHEKTGTLVDDLHIMSVDPLTYGCTQCGGTMRRTSEVIDTWFDSGSAPFAQLHYPFENKSLFEEMYPYDFIAEAIDQTRGWFYTMLVINGILFDKAPYKNVAVGGLLCDDNGEKMSKSKGNIVNPEKTFDEQGVDATRLIMANYPLGNNIKFGPSIFKEFTNPFFNTLWNTYFYARNYLEINSLDGAFVDLTALEDKWLFSKLNETVQLVTEHLEEQEYNKALKLIVDFTTVTLSKTYIKFIRERTAEADKALAFLLKESVRVIVHLLAPMAPFITEKIYQDFLKAEGDSWSVHFSAWPKHDLKVIDFYLDEAFNFAQKIITNGLAARDQARLGVRWPSQAIILDVEENLQQQVVMMQDLIKQQLNVKEIQFEKIPVTYKVKPNYRMLGKAFGQQTADVLTLLKDEAKEAEVAAAISAEKETFTVGEFEFTKDMFDVEVLPKEGATVILFEEGKLELNTTLTSELEAEGFARELTRRLQNLRKTAGLEKTDEVRVQIVLGDLPEAVLAHKESIMQTCGARELETVDQLTLPEVAEEKVKGKSFSFALERI